MSIDLSSLEKLSIIDLSGNKLTTFDISLVPKSLQELDLSRNSLQSITLGNDVNASHSLHLRLLRQLDVSGNDLDSLESLDNLHCKSLRVFQCHHNRNLRTFPLFLGYASDSLEVLILSHNQNISRGAADQIDLSMFEKLQTVDLSVCKLCNIPCISRSVIRLDLSSNKISSLSGLFRNQRTVSSSSLLVDLLMSDNYLVELDPMVVQQITELQRLDLKSNRLCTLPYQLGFLSKITTMELSGNPLTAKFRSSELSNPIALLQTLRNRAPKDEQQTKSCAMQVGVPALILGALTKGNTTLDFAGTVSTVDSRAKLQLIVEELKSSSTIAQAITGQLLLDSNYLQSLPGDLLSLLPNLSEVSITRNTLKELPREMLARSPQLRRIRLGRNLLTTDSLGPSLCLFSQNYYTLPAFVSSLTNLDLSANRIESFPANLSSAVFPSLEILNLSSNRIQTVNDWKQLPKSLTFLDLSENSIEDVEPLVYLLASDCPNLQNLSLMHNSLKRIPAILGLLQENCPRVASLNLKGNPQRGIPTHVQDYDCPRLLAYLANRLTPEHRMEAVRNIEERRTSEDIGVECIIVMEDMKEEEITEAGRSHQGEQGQVDQELSSELQRELERNIAQLESQLEYLSLSQAKRYALKKSLAMERSKLIRENRRLQWRK